MGQYPLPQPIRLRDSGPPPNANFYPAGKHESYQGRGSPEGLVAGDIGDEYFDIEAGRKWNKQSNPGEVTGWLADSIGVPVLSGPPSGYPTTEAANVVLMSDSLFITGATTTAENTPSQLALLLPDNFTVRNAAVSGNRIEEMIARYTSDIHPYAGGYAFLLGGYNDIANGESAADTFDELETLVNLFLADGFTLTVCTVPAVLRGSSIIAGTLIEYNHRIRNAFSNVFDLEMWLTPLWGNYTDGLHWSDAGHAWTAYGMDQKFQRGTDRWPISPGRIAPQVWGDVIDLSGNLSSGVTTPVNGAHPSGPGIGFLADGSFIYAFNGRAWLKFDSINGLRPASSLTTNIGSSALAFVNGWFSGDMNCGTLRAGFGTAASAIIEAVSTTKGFLPPRMTKAQRDAIAAPADGLMVYQTDNTPGLRVRENGAWVKYSATADP